jgi:hypothetical protein
MSKRFARFSGFVLMILAGGESTFAQMTGIEYERVLIPVLKFQPIAGAAGSLWETDLWMRNNASEPVAIYHYDYNLCAIGVCIPEQPPNPPTPPGISFRPILDGFPGVFLFVDRRHGNEVSFGLRARDLSRQSSTWGTEVPVVRESGFKTDAFFLFDVPTSAGFRSAVRIYGLAWEGSGDVLIRIRSLDPAILSPVVPPARPDELLAETVVHLVPTVGPPSSTLYPLFGEITDLGSIPGVGGHDRVSVEIVPATPGFAVWAFASIVHNESQHLTVISPQ